MPASYAIAWLLPWFTGCGLWWLVNGPRRFAGDVAASLGAGWLIGVLLAAGAASQLARGDTVHAVALVTPWLAATAVLAWLIVALRFYLRPAAWRLGGRRDSAAQRVFWWALVLLVLLRLSMLGQEAGLRPIFPWDAWSAWAVKPKSWFLLGQADAYVPLIDWLAASPSRLRTMPAWNYPELLAWVEIWFASGARAWDEALVNLAWVGALGALALSFYGYARGCGLRPWVSVALTYALASLPLLEAHAVLAGYADLWLASSLGLALMAWSRWLLFRAPGQAVLAIALAACLPAIKLEGAVWMLSFMLVFALELLPSRWRWATVAALVLLLLGGLALGGFGLPVPGLGRIHLAWGRVDIPGVATYTLTWHPVIGQILASLFVLPNWHLLWYLLPLLVLWRCAELRRSPAARLFALLVLLQLGLLFALFFFTAAAAWAADFTSVNRLILQLVPGLFVFAVLLLRDASRVPAAATEGA